jgi:hypothetical protein
MQLRTIAAMWRKNSKGRPVSVRIAGIRAGAALALCAAAWASPAETAVAVTAPKLITICHGYGCSFRTKLTLGAADGTRLRAIMQAGAGSPQAERGAISKAVQYFEQRSFQAIGVRDKPKADFGKSHEKGQMDCVDESTNTRALLLYLAERGLLKFHKVGRNVSRGVFIDGRYPHFTAIVVDPAGTKWVVDSWYKPTGGAPDIFPYEQWKVRGQFESDALD